MHREVRIAAQQRLKDLHRRFGSRSFEHDVIRRDGPDARPPRTHERADAVRRRARRDRVCAQNLRDHSVAVSVDQTERGHQEGHDSHERKRSDDPDED